MQTWQTSPPPLPQKQHKNKPVCAASQQATSWRKPSIIVTAALQKGKPGSSVKKRKQPAKRKVEETSPTSSLKPPTGSPTNYGRCQTHRDIHYFTCGIFDGFQRWFKEVIRAGCKLVDSPCVSPIVGHHWPAERAVYYCLFQEIEG